MQLKTITLAAIGAAWAFGTIGAGAPLQDTFATCQLAGDEREAACALPAGTTRQYQWDGAKSVFAFKIFLPATASGEWTVLEGVKARPLDDRLTAEVTAPGLKSPLKLPLDTWLRLVFARGRLYLAENDLGPFPKAGGGGTPPLPGWSRSRATASCRIGGGAEMYCTGGKALQFKSEPELDRFVRGIPQAFRTWTLPADQRRIAKGRSVKFEHGLAPTNTTPYTLVADVKFPRASWNTWRSIYAIDPKVDGAAFLNPQNRFGINGQYLDLDVVPDSTHRIAVAYNGREGVSLYWDGRIVVATGNKKTGFVGKWLYLGGDEDGEDGEIEIGQVTLFDRELDANTVKKLGGCK